MEFYLMTDTPEFYNDLCEEIRLFLSADKIDILPVDSQIPLKGFCVKHAVTDLERGHFISSARLYVNGKIKAVNQHPFFLEAQTSIAEKRERKAAVKLNLYRLLKHYTHKRMPWGPLTGIRPSKYLRDLEARMGEAGAKAYLVGELGVSKEKYSLAKSIVMRQQSIIESIGKTAIDIYIGIPFCPSICTYCSFGSKRLKEGDAIQNRYMDALLAEIEAMKPIVSRQDIRSVYIGGGTPTSLDLPVLERLLAAVREWGEGCEFTVEAGRPDTIDQEMLALLKEYGVNRISINPQTFKDETLAKVGRKHTVANVYTAYALAREAGFSHINLDLILGLPGETMMDMRRSLKKARDMHPESITVHTLAIKNAAAMKREAKYSADESLMERAVSAARRICEKSGYFPYYMYRQKYMKGNLENVGYARTDCPCIYNIDVMEEVTDILAFGAGAISKKIYPDEGRHERLANPKDLETYLSHIETLIQKKKALF